MGILLGLLAAVTYGAADFFAGVGSRRLAPGPITVLVQTAAVATAGVNVLLVPGVAPTGHVLVWGVVGGVGSALGTLALYRGMALGAMSPVATCSAVLAAIVPAAVGVATGDRLSFLVALGIGIAVPAIALVSWQGGAAATTGLGSGVVYGAVAGLGFGLLFVALDQAGTGSGAWPLLPSAATALLLVLPFARGAGRPNASWRIPALLGLGAGLLGGVSNLLFLRATGVGQLAVVAVLTSLYPVATVVLARVVLHERWTRVQAAGLAISAGAVVLVTLG
ncbi:MAG TPA: DMT family transporter [Frankiaceae bacterium]|nr:DMT family transporter [Frankiaceae bacterium]